MPSRFTHEQLVDKALLALREAMSDPRPASPALRFVLAFLYTGQDRAAFDEFWQLARQPCPDGDKRLGAAGFSRYQGMRSRLARISRLHGVDYY